MEWPPPRITLAVGFSMLAISSAMPSPASMSPPTVFSSTSSPSTSSDSSTAASSGMTCSYFVVLVSGGRAMCPSTCPIMVRQWMRPRLELPSSVISRSSFSSIMHHLPFSMAGSGGNHPPFCPLSSGRRAGRDAGEREGAPAGLPFYRRRRF